MIQDRWIVNNISVNILRLQPRDKAAMLVVNTKEIFLLKLHQNGVHFPAERNALSNIHIYSHFFYLVSQTRPHKQNSRFCKLYEN